MTKFVVACPGDVIPQRLRAHAIANEPKDFFTELARFGLFTGVEGLDAGRRTCRQHKE
jgi:hypothetical protein